MCCALCVYAAGACPAVHLAAASPVTGLVALLHALVVGSYRHSTRRETHHTQVVASNRKQEKGVQPTHCLQEPIDWAASRWGQATGTGHHHSVQAVVIGCEDTHTAAAGGFQAVLHTRTTHTPQAHTPTITHAVRAACNSSTARRPAEHDTDSTQLPTHSSRGWLCRGPGSVRREPPTPTAHPPAHRSTHTNTLHSTRICGAILTDASSRPPLCPTQHPAPRHSTTSTQHNERTSSRRPHSVLHRPLHKVASRAQGLSRRLLLLAGALTALPHAQQQQQHMSPKRPRRV